jgi:hypothetical protein
LSDETEIILFLTMKTWKPAEPGGWAAHAQGKGAAPATARARKRMWLVVWLAGLIGGGVQVGRAESLAGLWMGTARIEGVSEPQSGPVAPTANSLAMVITNDPPLLVTNALGEVFTNYYSTNYLQLVRTNISLTPTPVANPATLRLLLHVDTNNHASLLKEVTLMTARGTNARPVLVTNPARYSEFAGIAVRNGTSVGRRLSTTHFQFPETHLPMEGAVGTNGNDRVTVTNRLSFQAPTNPFKHRYHPDHDNLDATFTRTAREAYDLTRVISLWFSPTNLAGFKPGYGYDLLEGTYTEVVTGLLNTNIVATGPFSLRRVSTVGVLNDGQ